MDVVVTDTVADTVGTIDGLPDVSASDPVDALAFLFDFCFVVLFVVTSFLLVICLWIRLMIRSLGTTVKFSTSNSSSKVSAGFFLS